MNMYICICISYDTHICIPLVLFLWRTLTYIIRKLSSFLWLEEQMEHVVLTEIRSRGHTAELGNLAGRRCDYGGVLDIRN